MRAYLAILFGLNIAQISTARYVLKYTNYEEKNSVGQITLYQNDHHHFRIIIVKYGYKDVYFEKMWNLKLFHLEIWTSQRKAVEIFVGQE